MLFVEFFFCKKRNNEIDATFPSFSSVVVPVFLVERWSGESSPSFLTVSDGMETSILDLPRDVLSVIVDELTPMQRFQAFGMTCRRFDDLAYSLPLKALHLNKMVTQICEKAHKVNENNKKANSSAHASKQDVEAFLALAREHLQASFALRFNPFLFCSYCP